MMSARLTALAAHDARGAKLREDVLQERHRDALRLRDFVDLAGRVLGAAGELHDGAHGVVGLGGHVHTVILTYSAAKPPAPPRS
jgi:hypothetical protein